MTGARIIGYFFVILGLALFIWGIIDLISKEQNSATGYPDWTFWNLFGGIFLIIFSIIIIKRIGKKPPAE